MKKSKRKKTDDPFTDKYFEIMDVAQEMALVCWIHMCMLASK
jgi:hypothetical protein